jgi:hypothetical protein
MGKTAIEQEKGHLKVTAPTNANLPEFWQFFLLVRQPFNP